MLFHGDGEGRGEVRWRNGSKGRQHKWLIGPFFQKGICIFICIRVDTHFVGVGVGVGGADVTGSTAERRSCFADD